MKFNNRPRKPKTGLTTIVLSFYLHQMISILLEREKIMIILNYKKHLFYLFLKSLKGNRLVKFMFGEI